MREEEEENARTRSRATSGVDRPENPAAATTVVIIVIVLVVVVVGREGTREGKTERSRELLI